MQTSQKGPLILHIDTATEVCSVCIAENGLLLGLAENSEKYSHASQLHVLIDQLLKNLELSYNKLDAVAISMGPGSYTGLRIGVSAAKGYCFSLDIPLIAINSLQVMASYFLYTNEMKIKESNNLFCPMIDARRMEVYTAVFDEKPDFVMETNAMILSDDSFDELFPGKHLYFFGDGSLKFKTQFKAKLNATFIENFSTSSLGMIAGSVKAYNAGQFMDTAYFEPYYLKDFFVPPQKK